jgi:GGDEF domain-containing protein
MRDRGVLSRGGLIQVVGVGVVAYLGFRVTRDATLLARFEDLPLLPVGMTAPGDLPHVALVAAAVTLLTTMYGAYRWRGPVERALLWSALILIVALFLDIGPAGRSFLLMASGLLLSVSVLETSYFMAYRDELTGLPARRALMRELEQISGTYTLAMVDVDHFKKFNDTYGHDVGDQVLQLVASRLEAGPGGGKAFRYGGEEFTLMYPGRVKDDAIPHANAVRKAVEEAVFSLRAWNRPRKKPKSPGAKGRKRSRKPRKLSVTVSVGVADSTGKAADPEAVLKKADEALYRAKHDGRNRVSK